MWGWDGGCVGVGVGVECGWLYLPGRTEGLPPREGGKENALRYDLRRVRPPRKQGTKFHFCPLPHLALAESNSASVSAVYIQQQYILQPRPAQHMSRTGSCRNGNQNGGLVELMTCPRRFTYRALPVESNQRSYVGVPGRAISARGGRGGRGRSPGVTDAGFGEVKVCRGKVLSATPCGVLCTKLGEAGGSGEHGRVDSTRCTSSSSLPPIPPSAWMRASCGDAAPQGGRNSPHQPTANPTPARASHPYQAACPSSPPPAPQLKGPSSQQRCSYTIYIELWTPPRDGGSGPVRC